MLTKVHFEYRMIIYSFQNEFKRGEIMKRNWLIEIRESKDLKQYEVADAVGLSRCYYSAIENGIRKCPGVQALKIANYLEFPMEKFYVDELNKELEKMNA
jgi:DNA-binding XRE family transcriptional regulator